MEQSDTSIHEIETGNLAIPRWVLCPPSSVRVVNWNINRGLQLQRVIEFLGSTKADIIHLQERDLNARRTRHGNVARKISQKLQMNYVFGPEFQELTQGSHASPAYNGHAGLSRWPLSNSRILRIQKQSNFWHPHWFPPRIEPFKERIGGHLVFVSDANIAGKTVVTYDLHLERKGDDGLRCSQLDETLDDTRQYVFDESGRFVSVAHIAVMQAKVVAGVENWKQELERTLRQFGGNFGG